MTPYTLFNGFFLTIAAAAMATAVQGADRTLEAAEGPVVLRITGVIGDTNAAGAVEFDMPMIESLPVTEFTTETIWTEGPQTFVGVELAEFLDFLSAQAGKLKGVAINDYAVDVPLSDAVPGGPIIAYKMNGAYMSRRDKGPLWLVYPYDANPDYRSEVIYSRSIWQLDRLVAE